MPQVPVGNKPRAGPVYIAVMAFAGRLHPLLLHFPIALIIVAAVAELVAMLTAFRAWHVVAVANVRGGALFAGATALTGLLRARTVSRRRCAGCTGSRCSGRRHSSASPGISAHDSSGARTSCARNKEAAVKNDDKDWDRRGFLQCMAWVGTGAMWTMASGVLKGMAIEQAARG